MWWAVRLPHQGTTVHNDDYRVPGEFLIAGTDKLYTFARPDAGIWRISPSGDWTNAGTISYKVDIWTTNESFASHTAQDAIDNGESHLYTFDVPVGTASLETRLEWMNMNGNYPISDLDVILTPPTGPVVNACNTGRTPELCTVGKPVSGTWTARVVGFSIPGFGIPSAREHYSLRIEVDGNLISLKQR